MRSRVARATVLIALLAVVLTALAPTSGGAADSRGRGLEGTAGIIKFVGSGRIDSGPHRPGYVYPTAAAATARVASADPGNTATIAVPTHRRSNSVAATARRLNAGTPGHEVRVASSNPELALSFAGINHRDQVFSGPGGSASNLAGEPPDQGLCVGNGYVLETVNQALRVFDTRGNALTDPIALSRFYGYPPEVQSGPVFASSFDVSCYYDTDTHRWFHLATTADFDAATGATLGPNRLDIAVSKGPSPLGRWNYYAIPVQNDGTEGTPNHHCVLGPCFGDFPHIGADRNGVYITTNEFGDLFGPNATFDGANLYAISKNQLARGSHRPTIMEFSQFDYPFGGLAFRLWPAIAPGGVYERGGNGTEYLVSNVECGSCVGDNRLVVWAVMNTATIDSRRPSPRLVSTVVNVQPYSVVPPMAEQPPGNIPLAECIDDTTIPTPAGNGCWRYFFSPQSEPAHNETESMLDSGFDIFQVYFADGRLWTAQATTVVLNGEEKTGVAYYVMRPTVANQGIGARVELEGQFGLANNHVIYPTVAATNAGKAVISFSVVGENHYPSAGYVTLGPHGVGDIHIAAAGLGPIDGFTGYAAFGPPFQRFGDYGAAAVAGNKIWVAGEYVGQTCTLQQYLTDTAASPLFSCGQTRTPRANWATRISLLRL